VWRTARNDVRRVLCGAEHNESLGVQDPGMSGIGMRADAGCGG
jgi:hypothetical protein